MTMLLVCHGGMCCGIKTIHKLGIKPTQLVDAVPAAVKGINNDDSHYIIDSVTPKKSFFTDAAPKETYINRLDRFLCFVQKRRPKHIVEIVLAESVHSWVDQYKPWKDLLLERGFKLVTSATNSNSGNTVHIFHLVIDEKTKLTKPTEPEEVVKKPRVRKASAAFTIAVDATEEAAL